MKVEGLKKAKEEGCLQCLMNALVMSMGHGPIVTCSRPQALLWPVFTLFNLHVRAWMQCDIVPFWQMRIYFPG